MATILDRMKNLVRYYGGKVPDSMDAETGDTIPGYTFPTGINTISAAVGELERVHELIDYGGSTPPVHTDPGGEQEP